METLPNGMKVDAETIEAADGSWWITHYDDVTSAYEANEEARDSGMSARTHGDPRVMVWRLKGPARDRAPVPLTGQTMAGDPLVDPAWCEARRSEARAVIQARNRARME